MGGRPLSDGPVVAVVPVRLESTRLPGKALVSIGDCPMVVHVARRAALAATVDQVIVATDSARVLEVVEAAGLEGVMTSPSHATGTDRVAEVARSLSCGLVVNVQGDQPMLDPEVIDATVRGLLANDADVATPCAPLRGDPEDDARVKVVADSHGRAIYFSRSPIPHGGPFQVHLGVYVFRPEVLARFADWPRGRLEQAENLEQLRFIEYGVGVQVIPVKEASITVDTPRDLERLRSLLLQA